ncbi:MAG: hypothetical protein ACRCZI_14685 [Cetobacterium sp.]
MNDKNNIYELKNINGNLEILIHHDKTAINKEATENQVIEFPSLEFAKEGDIEIIITKNSIMVKEIGEDGEVLFKKHAFLKDKTKICSLGISLVDITEK